jgi:phosphotriesterase-related protein
MHEHVLINELRESRAEGLLNDPKLMRHELEGFSAAGGLTLVELSCGALSAAAVVNAGPQQEPAGESTRSSAQVRALARLSAQTGVQIVLGSGLYRDPYIDRDWVDRVGSDGIARVIERDATLGFGDTGVCAGIIGEVGSDSAYISAAEERALRGAARAHVRTGLTVTTHAARWAVGYEQLDILEAEGVDPRRVVVGHCDTVDDADYHLAIAQRGAFVEFDTIRPRSEYDRQARVGMILRLIEADLAGSILLSHDVCMRSHLRAFGGGGYTYILESFCEQLAGAGITDDLLRQLLVDNPRRALVGG